MKSTWVMVLAGTLAVVGCEKQEPSPGATKDATKSVTDAAKAGADKAKEAAAGAWEAAKSKALSGYETEMKALKDKVEALKASKPELYNNLSGMVKQVETKLADLKGAGSDKWEGISKEISGLIDKIKAGLK